MIHFEFRWFSCGSQQLTDSIQLSRFTYSEFGHSSHLVYCFWKYLIWIATSNFWTELLFKLIIFSETNYSNNFRVSRVIVIIMKYHNDVIVVVNSLLNSLICLERLSKKNIYIYIKSLNRTYCSVTLKLLMQNQIITPVIFPEAPPLFLSLSHTHTLFFMVYGDSP